MKRTSKKRGADNGRGLKTGATELDNLIAEVVQEIAERQDFLKHLQAAKARRGRKEGVSLVRWGLS